MIKTLDIINRLAAIISYGLNEEYSYRTIEERIVSSPFINGLENNEYNNETQIEKIVESTYNISLANKQADISFKGLFIAESYFKLFLYYNKSFEYIFLYWPLSYFLDRYGIYHEMDFSNLRKDFELKTKEATLLKKLSQDRNIKLVEISKLTGINENTIDKYSRDDKILYGASHDNIYKLAILFGVKENIFISNLAIYIDPSIYLFSDKYKDYRNYLGLLYANYFDKRINENDFTYDISSNCFESKKGIKLIVIVDTLANLTISRINVLADSKTYLVVIPSGFFGNKTSLEYLKDTNAFEVFVLTQEYVYIVKKNIKKEITNTINRSLITRTMKYLVQNYMRINNI